MVRLFCASRDVRHASRISQFDSLETPQAANTLSVQRGTAIVAMVVTLCMQHLQAAAQQQGLRFCRHLHLCD
jgi:hypothetical protein